MVSIRAIHFYGDSLTAGYGAAPEEGWIPRLSAARPALTLYNHGVCGSLIQDILDEAQTIIYYPAPEEALFLMGGTNDILSGIRYEALLRIAEEGITALAAKIPMLLGIPPETTRASIAAGWQAEWQYDRHTEELAAYADFLRQLAQHLQIPVVDFRKDFPHDDAYYADGIHPNAKGYTLMAQTAEAALAKLGI